MAKASTRKGGSSTGNAVSSTGAPPRRRGRPQTSPASLANLRVTEAGLANLQPPHEPTELLRTQVATMAGYGLTQPQIALLIDVSEGTLRKYYERELKLGEARATLTVSQTLYRRATSGDLGAAIFWMKARGGWSEKREGPAVQVTATANAAASASLVLPDDRRRAVLAIVRARALAEADSVGVGAAD